MFSFAHEVPYVVLGSYVTRRIPGRYTPTTSIRAQSFQAVLERPISRNSLHWPTTVGQCLVPGLLHCLNSDGTGTDFVESLSPLADHGGSMPCAKAVDYLSDGDLDTNAA